MTGEKHLRLIALLAAIIAITPLAVDMYLPAMPIIAQDLNTHIGSIQQSLSIYLAAYGAGMLLFGPLADMFGRRPLALFGLAGFLLSSIGLALCQQLEQFMLLRISQAFCGAAATVVAPGIVRYLYQENTAKGMSYMAMIMMLAPLLAPSIGSAVLWLGHWRDIFWLQAIYALVIWLCILLYLPEIPRQPAPQGLSRGALFFSGYTTMFGNASARPLIASMLFSSFSFFCFITAISFIYIQYFGVNEQQFSLLFGFNVIMLMLANWLNSRHVGRAGPIKMVRWGLLIALCSAAVLVAVNMAQLGLWFTVLSIAPLMMGLSLINTNTDALILMKFPNNTGSATAVNGTLRFGSGALAGPLLAFFHSDTPVPFALLMLSGVVGVLLCQLWYSRSQAPAVKTHTAKTP